MVSGVSEPALQTHNRNSSNLNCAYALTENRRLGRKFPQDLPALDKITLEIIEGSTGTRVRWSGFSPGPAGAQG